MIRISSLIQKITDLFNYRFASAILMLVVFIGTGTVEMVDHLPISKDQTHECNCQRMLPRLCQKNGVCPFKSGPINCCDQKPASYDGRISLSSKCRCSNESISGLASFNSYKFVQFDDFQIPCDDPKTVDQALTGYDENILNHFSDPVHPPPEFEDLS